jgi:hypothetical protein
MTETRCPYCEKDWFEFEILRREYCCDEWQQRSKDSKKDWDDFVKAVAPPRQECEECGRKVGRERLYSVRPICPDTGMVRLGPGLPRGEMCFGCYREIARRSPDYYADFWEGYIDIHPDDLEEDWDAEDREFEAVLDKLFD